MTAVHDGPVQEISKCPFMPHLLMSVGGYSFAIWNEGVMVGIFRIDQTLTFTCGKFPPSDLDRMI